jgi:hypothetical protein
MSQHLGETGTQVTHLLAKCINEIDTRDPRHSDQSTNSFLFFFVSDVLAHRPVLYRILF